MASLETGVLFALLFANGIAGMYLLLDWCGILAAHDAYERERESDRK